MDDFGLAVTSGPSRIFRIRWALSSFHGRSRRMLAHWLLRAVVRLADDDSNLMAHGRRELRTTLASKEDGPDRWMARDLMQLLAVFSLHGHSGFSAPYCASAFSDLARFQPLGPLTGEDDEWSEVEAGVFQNKRCGHVFKDYSQFGGQAYDLDGRIFREPTGVCYTNSESRIPITFPYTPKREYVDVPARSED